MLILLLRILSHKLSLNEYLCQPFFTDRDTLLVHDFCKRPPKPSIHKTLIRSTPAITLSLTYCHLVPYRGWSNPGFLDTQQPPTNPWHFGWSLSLSGFSKKQVCSNRSDRKAHSMFPAVQPHVGVGIGLVAPFHCRGSLGVSSWKILILGARKRVFQCILSDHFSLTSAFNYYHMFVFSDQKNKWTNKYNAKILLVTGASMMTRRLFSPAAYREPCTLRKVWLHTCIVCLLQILRVLFIELTHLIPDGVFIKSINF